MRAAVIVIGIVLSGCAFDGIKPPPREPVFVNTRTPVCSEATECEAKWTTAHEAIQLASGMRIQTATPTFIQTYGPTDGLHLGGRATKHPLGEGRYEIRGSFSCRFSGPSCDDMKAGATNLFNTLVGGSQ